MQATRYPGQIETDVEVESHTDSLPDRLINLGEYEWVLLTTEHTAAESAENRVLVNEDPRRLTPLYTYHSTNW